MPTMQKLKGLKLREIPLKDGRHDLDGFFQAIDGDTAVIWLCSPNNPTGSLIPSDGFELLSLSKFLKIFLSFLTKRISNILRI